MNIDRRQFIICDKKINREEFECVYLDCGMFLNYHKDLPVLKLGDNYVVGKAFSITPIYPVAENSNGSIEEQIQKWCGRFIVYSQGIIYTDVTNSFGVFYLQKKGVRIISSSIHLIVETYGISRLNSYELDFRGRGDTWDFYPGPYTPYKGIRRLMQYERLHCLGDQFVTVHSIEWNPVYKGMEPLELTQNLIQYIKFMLQSVAAEYDGIWVPLTGGLDSRCVCAWCKAANISFETYTEERNFETHGVDMNKADLELPKKISEYMGVKWHLCPRNEWDKKRWDNILNHSMGMIRNANLYSYAYNQYPKGKNKNIILHGSIFEISRGYYRNSMQGECFNFEERKQVLNKWLWRNLSKSDVHKKSILTWLKDIEKKGNQEVAWYDRFYYEQRLGSWLGDLNQAMDIIDFDRISPANNYEIISILLAYPQKMRLSGEHQKMIIEACVPAIKDLPINPISNCERIKWYYNRFKYRLVKSCN